MSRYRFTDEGYESGYESDGGTFYDATSVIGEGDYAQARKFQAKNGRHKAVLTPKKSQEIDYEEVQAKYEFFKTLYPSHDVELLKERGSYRLVLPLLPGLPYQKFDAANKKQQIKLFLCAIEALQDCHVKGYVVIDLKEDNIHFDEATGRSYLLDGGSAVKKGQPLTRFQKETPSVLGKYRTKFTVNAPECFYENPVASEEMDIYSLGNMMEYQFRDAEKNLIDLFHLCQNRTPAQRPSLWRLKLKLLNLPGAKEIQSELLRVQLRVQAVGIVQSLLDFRVDFSEKNTKKEIENHRNNLIETLNNLFKSHDELNKNYQALALNHEAIPVQIAFDKKKQEIEQFAQLRQVHMDSNLESSVTNLGYYSDTFFKSTQDKSKTVTEKTNNFLELQAKERIEFSA